MKTAAKIIIPLVILVVGVLAAAAAMKMKPKAERKSKAATVTTVSVMEARLQSSPAAIRATGVVEPAREVSLSPEVSGRVVWQSDELVLGGRVRSGQTLLRVDPRDYEIGIAQQESAVEQARLQLVLQKNQADIAKKEWNLLGNKSMKASPIALREPQVRAAEVAVKAAESGLRRSELALERTSLRAPFNGLVVAERSEVGQVVAPGAQVASLIGIDAFWVTAQVPVEMLAYVRLGGGDESSKVLVIQDLGGDADLVKTGRALRLKGGLDPATRTAQLIVEVPNPLDPEPGAVGAAALPLLPGAFVRLEIEGTPVEEAFEVPRTAIAEGDRVWTVDDDNRLRRRDVEVVWRSERAVLVRAGLDEGDRIVTSPLAMPMDGMQVSVAAAPATSASAAEPGGPGPGN